MIPLCPVPLWYRLNIESRVALILYQRMVHGLELDVPSDYFYLETIEEIERLMRQKPRHQVKVK